MAAVGIAFGFHAIVKPVEPTWAGKIVASAFLLIAILIFVSAEGRACRAIGKLEPRAIAALKPIRIRFLAWTLVAATMLLGFAMWLLIEEAERQVRAVGQPAARCGTACK